MRHTPTALADRGPPALIRSPSWSGSSVSVNSSVSQGSSSSGSLRDSVRVPDQDNAFDRYFTSRRGFLPPPEACIQAKLVHLASIPFRLCPAAIKTTSIHHHFFNQGAAGDVPSNFAIDIDDPTQFVPEVYLFCRFETQSGICNYAHKIGSSTTQRLRHIRNVHYDAFNELMNLREGQGEKDGRQTVDALCERKSRTGGRTDAGTPKRQSTQQQDSRTPTRGLTNVMAHGVAVSQLPMSIVSSVFTTNIIKHLDNTIQIPTESAVTEATITLSYKMAQALKQYLQSDADVGSFTADTWSTPGWSTKFIGLTFHYLNASLQPRSAAIGFARLEGPQTSEYLQKAIGKFRRSCLMVY